jgi:hypothetical protein
MMRLLSEKSLSLAVIVAAVLALVLAASQTAQASIDTTATPDGIAPPAPDWLGLQGGTDARRGNLPGAAARRVAGRDSEQAAAASYDGNLDWGVLFPSRSPQGSLFQWIDTPNQNEGGSELAAFDAGPAIPEPASLLIWSTIGFSWVGLKVWKRRGASDWTPAVSGPARHPARRAPWSETSRVAIRNLIEHGPSV